MKLRRMISFLLVAMLMMSVVSIGVSAYEGDLASTGYYNQDYLENYASAAYKVDGLGAVYTPSKTTLKLWAPEATSVQVKRFTTGTDSESGAAVIGTDSMEYNSTTGIWTLVLDGDHKNEYYTYIVNRKGVISETQDPYSNAVGANGDRSMICDLDSTDPDGWDQDQHVLFDNAAEAVVWEIHVREFSIDVSSGVSEANRGKYLAFTEGNTTVNGEGAIASCVDYLVQHNVNCVQLMPIEDFASIDETDDAPKRNWGYDPKNYNVPEGSYSSNPYDGNTRITEFKMLVQALHDRGISVVMDVVYNHTFIREGSSFNLTTPGYYYRKKGESDYHNGSGLGNTFASEKLMVSKFIQESLCYWVNEYHIDGFRFDLMGCFDLENMKLWRQALDKISPKILMYGEPWSGDADVGISNAINKGNLSQLDRVGGFNEGYSGALKGSHETATQQGFLNGKSDYEVKKASAGASSELGGTVSQFVNYTDNHDNWTLFDKILGANNTSGYRTGSDGTTQTGLDLYTKNQKPVNNPSAQVLGQVKIALAATLTTQGIPFTVAGTEFCRTKYGDRNSYRNRDDINAVDWTRAATYAEVADYYAGLAAIRKAVSAFTDSKSDAITDVSGSCTAWQITNSKSGQWNKIIVALNNSSSAKSINLSGSWTVVANSSKAGTTSLGTASGSYSLPAWSAAILVDSSSFGNYSQPDQGIATVTVEHYTRDSAEGEYQLLNTESASYKEGQTWRASKSIAILFDHNFDQVVSTAANNATYGSVKSGASITVKFYYTRYVKSGYLQVQFLNTSDSSRIKTPMKYRLRDGDPFSVPATSVQGYELDTSRYPAKTVGIFDADVPATFTFYYKPLENQTTIVHFYKNGSRLRGVEGENILCYAYDDNGIEALGAWPSQTRDSAGLKADDTMDEPGWYKISIPTTACYVMFHNEDVKIQVPDQGEKGYSVAGEAWIKNGVITFSTENVVSHIDLNTGKILKPDERKQYTKVGSDTIYRTSPNAELIRTYDYYAPAKASGFFAAGVTNIVYLYTDKGEGPADGALMGDADLDDVITVYDATFIQRALVDLEVMSEQAKTLADVDADGSVTIYDATYIQRYLVGLVDEGTVTGQRIGEEPVVTGEHTFDELFTVYNELRSKRSQYSDLLYGNDPYYQAASEVLSKYFSMIQGADAAPDEVDEAYDECSAALAGLDNIQVIEPGEEKTIYFSNSKYWDSVYVYYWGNGGSNTWPGVSATYVTTNNMGQGIFSITLSTGYYNNLIFTNGSEKSVDIDITKLTQNAIYLNDDTEEGGYTYGEWTYSSSGSDPIQVDPTPSGAKMYLIPSEEWMRDGARFAAYFFNDDATCTWVSMKWADDNLYSVSVPNNFSKVIFCRMNGASTVNSWDNGVLWNQTEDIEVSAGKTYTVVGWGK